MNELFAENVPMVSTRTRDSSKNASTVDVEESTDDPRDKLFPEDSLQNDEFNFLIHEDLLKNIKRELDVVAIENEFDPRRRRILEQIYNSQPKPRKSSCANEEIRKLKEELNLAASSPNIDAVLRLPRIFSRRNARFELPMDSTIFTDMTPMDYVRSYVVITCNSKLIYNKVFNMHLKTEPVQKRIISEKVLVRALSQVMGLKFLEKSDYFTSLLACPEDAFIDFLLWCGICALCERIIGPEIAVKYPDRVEDPPYEIEVADFASLPRKLHGMKLDERLEKILYKIRDL